MAKLQDKVEEVVSEEAAIEATPEQEVAPVLLNEAVPEKAAPGHHSRDFSA